jgi:hypothetical protein
MLRYQDFSLGINKVPNVSAGLDVSGNVAVAGYIDISGARISKDSVTGGIQITDSFNNPVTSVFNRVKTDVIEAGNIGVGTDNPLYNLHVLGDARIQGNLTVNGTQTIVNTIAETTERLEITNNGTGPALIINQQGIQPIVDFQDDGQTVFYIQNNGNVGIGTYQPQARLHIVGDVKATINWTDISGAPPYEIAPGNVVINNDNTQLDPSYILADGQTLNRVDYPELANALGVPSNQPTFTVPGPSYFQVNWNETDVNAATYIRNKPNIYGDASGNVGIGTFIMTQPLTVQGNAYFSGNISAGNLGMFRNRIINGDMRIAQRGTTYSNISGGGQKVYTMDRWFFAQNSTASNSVTQLTNIADLGDITTAIRLQRPNASTSPDGFYYGQGLESIESLMFKNTPITISFYLRAGSNLSGNIQLLVKSGSGTDQNPILMPGGTWTNDTNVINTVISNASIPSTFTRFTFTSTVPSNCNQLGILFIKYHSGTAGANDYIDVTGVQLEKGTIATPFEYRPYGIELQLCQRYYEASTGTPRLAITQWGGGVNAYGATVWFRVMKRTTPDCTAPAWTIWNSTNSSTISVNPTFENKTLESCSLAFTHSTTLPSAALFTQGTWTASAEL